MNNIEMSLDRAFISKLEKNYLKLDNHSVLENSISNNDITELFQNRATMQNYDFVFSKKISTKTKPANQEYSGRCWLFSFTNILRIRLIRKYKLKPEFYLSNTFLYFYDKLEKSYLFLKNMVKLKRKKLGTRLMGHLLKDPVSDGGFWNMAVNLIEKYGIIPNDTMRESYHSQDSSQFNHILRQNLMSFAKDIRTNKKANIEEMMSHIYNILCFFLGKPVETFTWKYYNAKDKAFEHKNLTPLLFYKKFVDFKPSEYVCLINYPLTKYPFYKMYSLKYCNNMFKGERTTFMNVPIELLRKYCINSLNDEEPIWFGCDVDKYIDKERGILDKKNYNFEALHPNSSALSKQDQILYGTSAPTHAMIFIGYDDLDKRAHTVSKWLVENSWGDKSGHEGYLKMDAEWFDAYVFVIVIKKKYLTATLKKILTTEPRRIDPWDSLSCEALMLK